MEVSEVWKKSFCRRSDIWKYETNQGMKLMRPKYHMNRYHSINDNMMNQPLEFFIPRSGSELSLFHKRRKTHLCEGHLQLSGCDSGRGDCDALFMLWTYCAGAQAERWQHCSVPRCVQRRWVLWLSLTSNTLQHPSYRLHAPMLAPRDCKVKRPGKVLDISIAYPPNHTSTQLPNHSTPTNESNTILQF